MKKKILWVELQVCSKLQDDVLVTVIISWGQKQVGDFFNVKNWSSSSENCHQHEPPPTSVTNMDLAPFLFEILRILF